MRLRALFFTVVSIALALFTLPVLTGGSGAAPPPPTAEFTQCPAIGQDTGCEFLITLPATGSATIQQDKNQGPYDGQDDTLVGIVNNTGVPISTVSLSSNNDIFNFDGDGICTFDFTGDHYCDHNDGTGYEGPINTFSDYSHSNGYTTGNVDFSGSGLASGSSTYFSLESSLDGATFTLPAVFTVTKSVTSSGPYYAGDTSTPITYSLSAHNVGDATGAVTIDDTVPSNTTLVSNSATCTSKPAGASCTPSVSGNNLQWVVTGVPAGDVVTVGFSVTPNAATSNYSASNTGTWTGDGCDTTPSCSTNPVSTSVTAPTVVTITANSTTTNYGTAPTVGYAISGDTSGAPNNLPTCTSTVTATTSPGTYSGANKCSGASDPRYTFDYVAGAAKVNQAPLTITASSGSTTYGGTVPTITAGYSGFVNSQGPGSLTTLPVCSTTATSSSPVGSYPSSCSGAADSNYSITYVNGSVSVGQATLTITASGGSMTYGGSVPTITAGYSGFVNSQGPGNLTTLPGCSTAAKSSSPVASYASSCSGAVDPNYNIVYVNGSVKVNPASLKITASGGTMTYGGTPPSITPSYSGFVNSDGPGSLTTPPSCSTAATSSSPVGSYGSSCTGAADPNYTISYANGSVSVSPAVLTIDASSGSMTYGGTVPGITPSYSGFVNHDGPASLTTPPNCSTNATSASPVGTYGSSCSGAADPNYTFSYGAGVVMVTPASLVITASSGTMTYGGKVPAITPGYSGLQNGDTAPAVPPNCSTTATSASPVGSYASSCSGASDPNYSITYVKGSVVVDPAPLSIAASSASMKYGGPVPTITPKYTGLVNGDTAPSTPPTCSTTATDSSSVGNYPSSCAGASDSNYDISYVDGTVTIGAKTLMITASSGSMTYGGTVPTITPSYSGFVNGQGPGDLTTPPGCSTLATSSSAVGGYTSSCSGAFIDNYTIVYVNGTVNVDPAALVITASSGTMTYGGTVPTITPGYSGLKNGDTAPSTAPNCSTSATSSSPAGTYASSCSGASDPNYDITYDSGSVVVSAAALTITASSGTMSYGGTVPGITPSYSGFVKGDGPGSLTTKPSCSTSATSSSPVGSYGSSCTGAADPNYSISYAPGSVAVDVVSLVITASGGSMTYGGTVPGITAGYSGFVNSDGPGSLTTLPSCSTSAKSSSAVGSYGSSCSGAADPNYDITYVNGSVSVNPTPLTVTASSGSMTYGGSVPVITPDYTGLVNGDTAPTTVPTCTTAATGSSPVGTYGSSCSGAGDSNYTISYAAGTVTVNPASLTITASSPTVIVGNAIPTVTPNYSGLVNGDTAPTTAPTCTTTATSTSPSGPYTTSCSGAADTNYTITYVNGSLTLTPGFAVVKSVSPGSGVVAGSSTPLVYTLVATNSGLGTTSSAVSVADSVPNGTTLVTGSPACKGGSPTCTVAVSGNNLTWTIPSGVAPGAVYTLTFSVTTNAGDATGPISNTATWTGPGCVQSSPAASCSTNTATTTVAADPPSAPAAAAPAAPAATPDTPVPAASGSALAFTGALITQEWMFGLGALLLGALLVAVARRRRRDPEHTAE